jgi:hypothetical protein
MHHRVHGPLILRVNVQHCPKTVTAQRLPAVLSGGQVERHGVQQPIEPFAAFARDLREFLHPSSLEHAFSSQVRVSR